MNSRPADDVVPNENDLLWLVYQTESSKSFTTAYPKITYIPRGRRISPDIDLLTIYELGERTVVTGFETKLVNQSRNILGPFYTALGQALCYFQHGVDQAYVVLGCYGLDEQKRADTEAKIQGVWEFVSTHSLLPQYVGFKLFTEGRNRPKLEIEPKYSFAAPTDSQADFRRRCLIQRTFVWGKGWLRERGGLPPK